MKGLQINYNPACKEDITVALPTSKSMAARALIIAALAGVPPCDIHNLPVCSDTTELTAAINALLSAIPDPASRIATGDSSPVCLRLNLGLGGTSLRFFTALAASIPDAEFEIDCAAPLKKRPLAPLCEALNTAGAHISYLDKPGYPPLLIKGKHIPGGEREISAAISSQFISAMIMTAPYWKEGLRLSLTGGEPVSFPYIDMTVGMMRRAGAEVKVERDEKKISVARGSYDAGRMDALQPEADWSAASYFYELALTVPERVVRIASLTPPSRSLQGDSACDAIFARVGVETEYLPDGSAILRCDKERRDAVAKESASEPVLFDMSATPDLVPALAVGLCLAGIRFRINGIGHLRHKESDRIMAIQLELEKIGYQLHTGADAMAWLGERMPIGENEAIETWHDHRIAMAFAPAAARLTYLSILNPEVTEKSFPDYFDCLAANGFAIRRF